MSVATIPEWLPGSSISGRRPKIARVEKCSISR
jgi:hypothetical protein